MEEQKQFSRIMGRARGLYRFHRSVDGAIRVGVLAAAATFVLLLVAGLGFLPPLAWSQGVIGMGLALAVGATAGALRPLRDGDVVRFMDRDYGLKNAMTTARELLFSPPARALNPVAAAHVRQTLAQARRLGFARTLPGLLGTHARILGVLCICCLSVALI